MPEDEEHVFFWCQRYIGEGKELEDTLGSTPEPETLMKLMLTMEPKWSAVSGFATAVMKRLTPRRGAGAQEDGKTNSNGSP